MSESVANTGFRAKRMEGGLLTQHSLIQRIFYFYVNESRPTTSPSASTRAYVAAQ
jgi:hypothetical protein